MGLLLLWFFPLCPQWAVGTRNSLPGHKVFPDVAQPLDSTNILSAYCIPMELKYYIPYFLLRNLIAFKDSFTVKSDE